MEAKWLVMAVTHLAFSPDAYVAIDRCVRPQVNGLLNAHVGQRIFSEDGPGIQVGSHEATEARQCLDYKTKRRERINKDVTTTHMM